VRLPNSLTILVLTIAAFGFVAFWAPRVGIPGFWLSVAALIALVLWRRFNTQGASKRWLARAADRPLVLQPPFTDRWRVESGGPDPRHNHHLGRGDQYFAYDFVREGGDSWDQPILAPCDGLIVHMESRQLDAPPGDVQRNRARPFGNYVSIETAGGFVILAHLRQGSVLVRVGENVQAGDEIGRCGNSGTTHHAHLHVHAQNQPSQVDSAQAIPIAFVARGASQPMLLEYGDVLG
jgi:murein DD-endopeptidase MepM/ murein hydrolase activator NlpD